MPVHAPTEANWQRIEAAKRQLPSFQITKDEFAAMPVWVISLERSTERRWTGTPGKQAAHVRARLCMRCYCAEHVQQALMMRLDPWQAHRHLIVLPCRQAMSASMAAIAQPFEFLPATDGAGQLSPAEARHSACALVG